MCVWGGGGGGAGGVQWWCINILYFNFESITLKHGCLRGTHV